MRKSKEVKLRYYKLQHNRYSDSFKFKVRITGRIPASGNTKNVEIAVNAINAIEMSE